MRIIKKAIAHHTLRVTYLLAFTAACLVKNNKPKRQQELWRLECELGVIQDPECPVDGDWASWSMWSQCRGSCDDVGFRRRTRQCNNPAPSEDGLPCIGNDEQIEPCYISNCTVDDFRRLTEGDTTRKGAFRQLEAVPALMERCLQMDCPYEAIEAALANDNTWQLNPESLWNSLLCVKRNLGCPVVGGWGDWGEWSACGARCGHGLRWRLRRCDSPRPSGAHTFCTGTPLQAAECDGEQCAVDIRLMDVKRGGAWSPWGEWTECSEGCGAGVRRRRRVCLEKIIPRSMEAWGTHCVGQHDQVEVCHSECVLAGGWSGWDAWGPCSQTCGVGRRSRVRSCTRPVPSGNGSLCDGAKTEISSCLLKPCESFTHMVALMIGDSNLRYDFDSKRSALFHFYMRFMPLSPHGTLVRRGSVHNPYVRLSLQKWHVCLDASGTVPTCTLAQICAPATVDPAVWHTALITVTNEAATLRLNDARVPIKATFACDPELPDEKMNIVIGEKLHGAVQEVFLNFMPLELTSELNFRSRRSVFSPTFTLNVAYEKAGSDEGFLTVVDGQYLRLPCFVQQDEWQLDLTVKSKRETGTILFMPDDSTDSWLYMGLQNQKLKLKFATGDFRSESSSLYEYLPEQWLHVTLTKKRDTDTIEALINTGDRIHVVVGDDISKERQRLKKGYMSLTHEQNHNQVEVNRKTVPLEICEDDFYIGALPGESKLYIEREHFTPFSGEIAAIRINKILQDLHDFSVERHDSGKIQLSSRTASVSGTYYETSWGKSKSLNLTCLHARTARSPHSAQWLYLDLEIRDVLKDKKVRSIDDGRVLRLVASAENDMRGFYTCRGHANKRTRNIITYGVVGGLRYDLSGPDFATVIAVISSLLLVAGTLTWLIIEGIYDLRNGFGFFRDAHLSPEEEAEAVCRYIDENIDLIGSKATAEIAKARARERGRQLASPLSFSAQEPEGLMQIKENSISQEESSMPSDPDAELLESELREPQLPTLPIKRLGSPRDIYRCEPCYESSPRHGSNLTSRTKLSSSSLQLSPRFLCSRLMLSKAFYSSSESMSSRSSKPPRSRRKFLRNMRSNLVTIKSSSFYTPAQSPAQMILKRFRELRNEN